MNKIYPLKIFHPNYKEVQGDKKKKITPHAIWNVAKHVSISYHYLTYPYFIFKWQVCT